MFLQIYKKKMKFQISEKQAEILPQNHVIHSFAVKNIA